MTETTVKPKAHCSCWDAHHPTYDKAYVRLLDLMAGGLDQPAASRIAFDDAPDVPAAPAEAPGWVRRTLTARLPWLRETGAVDPLLLAAAWVALFAATCAWAVIGR